MNNNNNNVNSFFYKKQKYVLVPSDSPIFDFPLLENDVDNYLMKKCKDNCINCPCKLLRMNHPHFVSIYNYIDDININKIEFIDKTENNEYEDKYKYDELENDELENNKNDEKYKIIPSNSMLYLSGYVPYSWIPVCFNNTEKIYWFSEKIINHKS